MPVNIPRLRFWFAIAAITIVALVAGFYFFARYRVRGAVAAIPEKLGVKVEMSTEHFSLSRSRGGRTVFTVRADRAMKLTNGHVELKNVQIVIYGRQSNRFDQIYGADFKYDQESGLVTAQGPVQIDLEADPSGILRPDQAPPVELKNPIHLVANGLVFNHNTGNARVEGRVEFRIPQANGWAEGATYDSNTSELVLERDVNIVTSEPHSSRIVGKRGVISKDPRQAVLYGAHLEQDNSSIDAAQLTLALRTDNSIDHVLGTGGVVSRSRGATSLDARSPAAVVYMRGKSNQLRMAKMMGGAVFQVSGANTMSGSSDEIHVSFGNRNLLSKVRAQGNVKLIEPPKPDSRGRGQTVELAADAVDFDVKNGRRLERAETSNNARVTLTPVQQGGQTVITAGKFYAGFSGKNRINSLRGFPDAKVVSRTLGQSDRVSTSRLIEVVFGAQGGVESLVQRDQFQYRERLVKGGERAAWAQLASYSPNTQLLTLTGRPRVVEGGMTTTAREIRIDRSNGDAIATGEVKTTYSDGKPQPSGALLASGDPIHVTARTMTVNQSSEAALYSGDARLWQSSNIIQAPSIEFSKTSRKVRAAAEKNSDPKLVTTLLVQPGKNGKLTPVSISSSTLTYDDAQRLVHLDGRVTMRSADGITTADKVDIFLRPGERATKSSGVGQIERIVAEGAVRVQQPTRQATGEKLVYTAAQQKFVLSGGAPSLTDAEHGTIQGASLTFYRGDDRVLVEGGESGRTTTTTQVPKRASK